MTAEHFFTPDERRDQMVALIVAIDAAIPVFRRTEVVKHVTPSFEQFALCARSLLRNGFTQVDLSALLSALPDPLRRNGNPRWEPPLERTPQGRWRSPAWYVAISPSLNAISEAADVLKTIGYY